MDDHDTVRQRITTVETTVTQHDHRLDLVEMTQIDLKNIVNALAITSEKATELAHALSQKTAINELTIMAVKDRTDLFAGRMETIFDRLVTKHYNTATKVAQQAVKWSVAQAIALAVVGVLAAILMQHLFHF